MKLNGKEYFPSSEITSFLLKSKTKIEFDEYEYGIIWYVKELGIEEMLRVMNVDFDDVITYIDSEKKRIAKFCYDLFSQKYYDKITGELAIITDVLEYQFDLPIKSKTVLRNQILSGKIPLKKAMSIHYYFDQEVEYYK